MAKSASAQQTLALVIGGDRAVSEALSLLLEELGLRAPTLSTGDAALAWLAAENPEPDLILLDIDEPSSSGMELVRRLRNHPATRDVPIVLLSSTSVPDATAQKNLVQLTKPFARERLKGIVRGQLAGLERERFVGDASESLDEHDRRRLVGGAIRESLSGLLSVWRAQARAEGQAGRTLQRNVSLAELRRLVQERLDGLRGQEAPDEAPDSDSALDGSEEAYALKVETPTLDELRAQLPAHGVRVTDDRVELEVHVPAARRAHAR